MLKSLLVALTLVWAMSQNAAARPFIDAGGRVVEIPDQIHRAYPAGPPAAVMIYVAAPDKLLGWHRQPSGQQKQLLLPAAGLLRTLPRLTGRGDRLDLVLLQSARPDIIIDIGTVNDEYIALANKVQKETGIPYVLIDGSLAKTAQSLRQLGAVLGVEQRAEALALFAETTLSRHEHDLSQRPTQQRPTVYYGRGARGLETALAGSLNAEAIAFAGGRIVSPASGTGDIPQVTLDQLRGWDPDVIVAASLSLANHVRSDADWAKVAAVASGRVFVAPKLPFDWIDAPPSVNRLIGLNWLEQILYPGSETDLNAEARSFFKLFYHIDVSESQMQQILQGEDLAP